MSHDRKSRASSTYQGSEVGSDTLTEYSYETIGTIESDDATTFGDHVRNVMDAMMGCCEDRQMRPVRPPDVIEDNFMYGSNREREIMGMVPSQLQYVPGSQYPHSLPPHPHHDNSTYGGSRTYTDSRTEDSRADNETRDGTRVRRRKGGKKDTKSRKRDKGHRKKSKTKKEKAKSDTKKKSKGKNTNDDDDEGEEEVEEKRTRRKGKKSSEDSDEEDSVEEKKTRRKGKKDDIDGDDGAHKGKKYKDDTESNDNDKEESVDDKRTRRKGRKTRDGSDDDGREDSFDEKKTRQKEKKARDVDEDNFDDRENIVDEKRTRRKEKKSNSDDDDDGDDEEKRTRRKEKKSSEDSDNGDEVEKKIPKRTRKRENDSDDREEVEELGENKGRTAGEQNQPSMPFLTKPAKSDQTRQETLQIRDDHVKNSSELRDASPGIPQQDYLHPHGNYNSQDPSHNHKNFHTPDPSHNYEDYHSQESANYHDNYHHQDNRNPHPERHSQARKQIHADDKVELHEIGIDAHASLVSQLEPQEQQALLFLQKKLALGGVSIRGTSLSHDPQLPLPRGHGHLSPTRMQNTHLPGAAFGQSPMHQEKLRSYNSRSPSPTKSNPSPLRVDVGTAQIPTEVRTSEQDVDDFSYITGPKVQLERSHNSLRSHNSSHHSNNFPSVYQDISNQSTQRRQSKLRPHSNTNFQGNPQLSHSRSQTHTTGHHSRQDYQMMSRSPSQSQTTTHSSRQESTRVKVLRSKYVDDTTLGSFDETALMEVRIPAGQMALSLVPTRNGLVIDRKSNRSVATGLSAGDTLVALDGVDISKFSPEVVTNLLKTRENQPCRSIVYYPGSAQ